MDCLLGGVIVGALVSGLGIVNILLALSDLLEGQPLGGGHE